MMAYARASFKLPLRRERRVDSAVVLFALVFGDFREAFSGGGQGETSSR